MHLLRRVAEEVPQGSLVEEQVRVKNNRLAMSDVLAADQLADVHDATGYQYMPFPRDEGCAPQGEWIRRKITADSWIPVFRDHDTTIVVASAAHLGKIDMAVAEIRSLGLDVKAVEKALRAGYRAPNTDKSAASAAVTLFRDKLAVFQFPGNRLVTRTTRSAKVRVVSLEQCWQLMSLSTGRRRRGVMRNNYCRDCKSEAAPTRLRGAS